MTARQIQPLQMLASKVNHQDDHWVAVGRLGTCYGLDGWIWLRSLNDQENRLLELQPWFIKTSANYQRLELLNFNWSSDHRALRVQLAGYSDALQVKALVNCLIYVPRSQLPKLNQGEYYWHDLIGLKVYGLDGLLGKITQLFNIGPHDVAEVKDLAPSADNKKPCLIPWIDEVIEEVNIPEGYVKVRWRRDYLSH